MQVFDRHVLLVKRVLHVMEQANLNPILLKGVSIAVHYPKPYLRQWGDLDVLINGEDQDRMLRAMEYEFPDAEHNEEYEGYMRHLNFDLKEGVTVEVHRATRVYRLKRKNAYYQQLEKEAIRKARLIEQGGVSYRELEPNFNLLFVFIHAWEHFVEGNMTMRHFSDQMVLQYIMVNMLGMPIEFAIGYSDSSIVKRKAEGVVNDVLKAKIIRYIANGNKAPIGYVARKWYTFRLRLATARRIRPYSINLALYDLYESVYLGVERWLTGKDKNVESTNWVKK